MQNFTFWLKMPAKDKHYFHSGKSVVLCIRKCWSCEGFFTGCRTFTPKTTKVHNPLNQQINSTELETDTSSKDVMQQLKLANLGFMLQGFTERFRKTWQPFIDCKVQSIDLLLILYYYHWVMSIVRHQ